MIIFFHLLNDRSGSPKVLASVISALRGCGRPARLFVGSDGSGCLDEVGVPTTRYWYRRGTHRLVTLFTYFISQACLFMRLARARDLPRDAVFYVNTLLPFGAALYGLLTRRFVVYHLHEVSVSPTPLRWFLTGVARLTADRLIYVSDFHRSTLPIPAVPALTVHNALDEAFLLRARANIYLHRRYSDFNVLMLASLRDYKGVPELVTLAQRLQGRDDIRFHLVVNDGELDIHRYFQGVSRPANLEVYPRTNDPGAHYAKANLVLNLSRPDMWVETFGLTLLEAMAYGVPVIAPPVGGPVELVSDGVEGYLIDCRNGESLADKVRQLADNESLCLRLSEAARRRSARFSPTFFAQALREVVDFELRS
jgi:glycosyltransferase involved in cell wall biosynthesis